jgi:hypothetical protein
MKSLPLGLSLISRKCTTGSIMAYCSVYWTKLEYKVSSFDW